MNKQAGNKPSMSRRGFLSVTAAAAGAIAFDLSIPMAGKALAAEDAKSMEVHSWVVIHPDNRVTVRIPQAELGQGVSTALAQLIADEMDLELPMIDWEFYDPQTNRVRKNVYVHTATLASFAVDMLFGPMRTAGAQIRSLLLAAAAKELGVAVDKLEIANHEIKDKASGKSVGFGAVAAAAAKMPIPDAASVKIKDRADWRYIGKSVDRSDAKSKSIGEAIYGVDVVRPGMKYAAVKQSPVFGGRLHSFDATEILKRPGIHKVVKIKAGPTGYTVPPTLWDIIDWEMDDAVAVVADSWWDAQQALDDLPIVWDEGDYASVSSATIAKDLDAALAKDGMVVRNDGDVKKALAEADTKLEAQYHYPFLEHATMEPMTCTAIVNDLSVEAWAPTQYGDEALRIAAYAAGITLIAAKFHLTLAGGGFGRRLHNDYVSQAVQIAKQMKGVPIKFIASREETLQRSYYPPALSAKFEGGLNKDGEVTAWSSHVAQGKAVFQPYGMTRTVFPFPNIAVEYSSIDTPPPFAWMRGVGHTQHAWMNHCFMSELAKAAGQTPLDFMLKHLDESKVEKGRKDYDDAVARIRRFNKVLGVLEAKTDLRSDLGKGRGRGIGIYDMSYIPHFHSTCIALSVEVNMDGDDDVNVEKVVVAVDCGTAINPQIVEAQIESGVIFGLSNALYGEITLKDGRVEQSNFHDYPIMRMSQSPKIEVHIMPSEARPSGVGEGPVPVIIGALLDAIEDASGKRIRALPVLSPDMTLRS